LEPLESVPSVDNEEMDDEHEHCIESLNTLVRERSAPSLLDVLKVLKEHFDHEQSLLDEHVYADVEDKGFAATAKKNMRTTHYADHDRILELIQDELVQVMSSGAKVRSQFIQDLLTDFNEHADKYDGAYAKELHAALSAH